MSDFTTTTNFSLKKPTVGQAVDLWGTYINSNFDEIDSQLQTLTVSIQTPDLEGLGNVLNTTPAKDDFLRFNGESWAAATVSIPTSVDDLSDVDTSTTAPTTGQALIWSGSKWSPSTPTAASIDDGSITTAKLDTGLQTQIGRILVTDDDDSPTNGQILQYSTADTEWKYADLPGSTVVTLSDVNSASLADNALLVYNSSAGEFQFESGSTLRTTLGVDSAGTDNSTDISISTATSYDYIVLSAGQVLTINQVDLQTDVANTLPVTSGGTGSTTVSGARTALGVSIGSDVQAWDQQLDDISALAVTDGNIIVGNGTTWVAESGATARASLGLTIGSDVEAYSSTNADYADITANFTGTLQNGGSNVVVDSDIGSSVQGYDADTAKYDDTTANFTGTLQNGGSNVVVDSDIGSSVQGYDADTAKYDDTTANFTGTLQNGGSNVVVDSDIGSSVQAYDADLSTIAGLSSADGNFIVGSATGWVVESGATVRTSLGLAIGTDVQAYDANTAKYNDTTANFTGTLQNGGSDVLVATDIGSTVQAAGSYLTSVDLTSNVTGTLPVANGGTGVSALSSLDAADLGSNNGVTDATDGYVLTADGTGGTAWEAATGGISDVVSDTTPQLGGNLDVNGQSIVSVSAGNISITPDTTGKIILDGLSWPTADGSADQVLQTDGAGNLSFVDQSGGGGSGSSYIEHANSISDSITVASGNNRLYIGDTAFSGSLTVAGKMVILDGPINLTGTMNLTGTLSVRH